MPDIAMCPGIQCETKNNCYRYRAKPEEFGQTYADFRPDKEGICTRFWDIEGYLERFLVPVEEIEQDEALKGLFNHEDADI